MKDYGHLFADDPEWAARAAAFSAKVRDVTELLAGEPERRGSRSPCGSPTTTRVTWHTRRKCGSSHALCSPRSPASSSSSHANGSSVAAPQVSTTSFSPVLLPSSAAERRESLGDRRRGDRRRQSRLRVADRHLPERGWKAATRLPPNGARAHVDLRSRPNEPTILGPVHGRAEEILSPEALAFVRHLQREFGGRASEAARARAERQAEIDAGGTLDFLAETREVRERGLAVEPAPHDLQDRRVEITGPTTGRWSSTP